MKRKETKKKASLRMSRRELEKGQQARKKTTEEQQKTPKQRQQLGGEKMHH